MDEGATQRQSIAVGTWSPESLGDLSLPHPSKEVDSGSYDGAPYWSWVALRLR